MKRILFMSMPHARVPGQAVWKRVVAEHPRHAAVLADASSWCRLSLPKLVRQRKAAINCSCRGWPQHAALQDHHDGGEARSVSSVTVASAASDGRGLRRARTRNRDDTTVMLTMIRREVSLLKLSRRLGCQPECALLAPVLFTSLVIPAARTLRLLEGPAED